MIEQLFRFGLIGVAATLIHWTTVALVVHFGIVPLLANVIAFAIAFQVSYWGHRRWTFQASLLTPAQTLPRFSIISCSSFLLIEFMYFLLLKYTSLEYWIALIIVLALVAFLTYLLSWQWAFNKA